MPKLNLNAEIYTAIVNRGIAPSEIPTLSVEELFAAYLEWHGIIGYTQMIMNAHNNIRAFKETAEVPE